MSTMRPQIKKILEGPLKMTDHLRNLDSYFQRGTDAKKLINESETIQIKINANLNPFILG